ncbi:MAG: glycoside hydrolase family 2 TIM barrel-domain containing protein, partial [Acidobacteriota bacterium]
MSRRSMLGWAAGLVGLLATWSATGVAAASPADPGQAVETRRMDLSGLGPDAPVPWDFRCLGDGRRCVSKDAAPDAGWTTIPVPSQWQQQGFGTYSYGHDEDKPDTVGEYRRSFSVPPSWAGGRIEIVFEGAMTDTEIAVDGEPVGAPHRGGFYRFTVDLTDRVTPGREHRLDVRVAERSADRSVEKAERDADYWVFGGIYRPVWLRWRPAESIDHVAIDARHDGSFRALVRPHAITAPSTVHVTVVTADGRPVGTATATATATVAEATGEAVEVAARFEEVETWSAEAPRLHIARFELMRGDTILHRVDRRFGFRTIEFRHGSGDASNGRGLYVNGRRTLLRGINRHAFWPTTGRAISDAMDRADAERLKAMNLNAVRASHYPPDRSFLDACDELGLYVIDELAGWHDAYSTRAGRPLVRSMVERDVNHPSILMWANGNEDGWNTDLDDDFAVHDPQARPVLHTRSTFRGVDADHYADWAELDLRLDPTSWLNRRRQLFGLSDEPLPLFLPTEILHGLYDGGSGAGLERYWRRLRRHPRAMGLFLWVYSDEAIERTDRTPEDPDFLDAAGNYAPDGVLGPFREVSANVRALQEVFTPVAIELVDDPSGRGLAVENRFDHTALDRIVILWRWERLG